MTEMILGFGSNVCSIESGLYPIVLALFLVRSKTKTVTKHQKMF